MNIKNITRNFRTLTLGLCMGFVFTHTTGYAIGEPVPASSVGGALAVPIGPPMYKTKPLTISKFFKGAPMPGTYTFTVICTPTPTPSGFSSTVILSIPATPSATINVPYNDVCTITETTPTPGTWNNPVFMVSPPTGVVNGAWKVTFGPVTSPTNVRVTNDGVPGECHRLPHTQPPACGGNCPVQTQKCQIIDPKTGTCGCK